jgi:hypothetical protein
MLRASGGAGAPFFGGHQITDAWSNGADRNNYNPTGLATALNIVITVTLSATTLSGIAAQPDGTVVRITCSGSSTVPILFIDENTNSSPVNRFQFNFTNTGASPVYIYFLNPGQSIEFIYSGSFSRWQPNGNAFMAGLFDVDMKSVPPLAGNGSTQPGHGLSFQNNSKWAATPFVQQSSLSVNLTANGFTTVINPVCIMERYVYATGTTTRSIVSALMTNFTGVSNTTAFTITGFGVSNTPVLGALPCFILPGLTDNGVLLTGTDSFAQFDGATLTFFKTNSAAGWTAAGTKGLARDIAFTYVQNV